MILAVDVGTTQLKAGLFDLDGRPAARAEAPLALIPHPDPLWHEADARTWVAGLERAAKALGVAGAGPIEAVVVSGNGPTLVPVGADGAPLAPAMTWMDRRAVEEARLVADLRGAPTDPTFSLPKALWVMRNRPRLYEQARWFFGCPEYLSFVLTAIPATFLPTPEYTRYYWETSTITALGMDPGKFPPFEASGRVLGTVTPAGQAATGIPAGVPVVSGGPDFIVSLLGTTTVVPGRACIRAGTSEGINLCSRTPISDRRLLCVSHVAPGCWNVSGMISTSGKALEWCRTTLGRGAESWDAVFAGIEEVPAGADRLLFLPYLAGERAPLWDPRARGAFVGLTLNHGSAAMLRAVAESVGFAIRDVVTVMEELGLVVQDLRITGRPARNRAWNQMRADIAGRRILVPEAEDSDLAGDVCLALVGLGVHASPAEAAEAIVRIGSVFEPRAERTRVYDELFALYRESYRGLKAVFEKLSTPRSAS
jgi:xylulokinase